MSADIHDNPPSRGATGATVAARIAHWRNKTWAELCDLMVPEDGVTPPAGTLDAPSLSVRAQRAAD